jgi:hypothetical protein
MSFAVTYFLAFLPAATAYYYDGRAPEPRIRHEVNVAYRTISDCLIAAEAKDRFYRMGSSWLVYSACTIDNPNDHR